MSGKALEEQLVRQGWAQTAVAVLSLGGLLLAAWTNLSSEARAALNKADNAEQKAKHVEGEVDKIKESNVDMGKELIRIRTILEERLPNKRIPDDK